MEYILLFCDVDEEGNIIGALMGKNIIPNRQYDYFFFTNDPGVLDDISKYKVDVVTRQLVRKDAI